MSNRKLWDAVDGVSERTDLPVASSSSAFAIDAFGSADMLYDQ